MKRIAPLICTVVVLIMIASCSQNNSSKSNQAGNAKLKPKIDTAGKFTLNGLSYTSANAMIAAFRDTNSNNHNNYDRKNPTCIWFGLEALQAMATTLEADTNSDGIRFYFAKTIPDGQYTVVAVSTTDGGIDTTDTSSNKRHWHNDYFQNSVPVLQSDPSSASLRGKIGDVTRAKGAALNYPTPPCKGSDNCTPTPHYISCKTAYEFVYGNTKNTYQINAKSEWFDKGVINSLIKVIPPNGGIRFYYAMHSKPSPMDTVARHGLVAIVTAPGVNNIQQDQYLCIQINPHYHYFQYPKGGGGGADNGEECPTNCSGSNWP